MALELLKNATLPKTTTIYPIRWRSRIYAIVGLVLLLGITVIVTLAVGSTQYSLSTQYVMSC